MLQHNTFDYTVEYVGYKVVRYLNQEGCEVADELSRARFRALRDMVGRTLVIAFGAATGLGIIYLINGYEPFTFLGLFIGMTAPWLVIGLYRFVRPEAQLKAEAKQRGRRTGYGNLM